MSGPTDDLLTRAPVAMTLKDLLGLWGFRFRNDEIVQRIDAELTGAGLTCTPPPGAGRMADIVLIATHSQESPSEEEEDETRGIADEPLPQVTLRVGDLRTARSGLVSIQPEDTLQLAQSLMQKHEYSQLAVLSGPVTLLGGVSWESIAHARVRNPAPTLADATVDAEEVCTSDDLFAVIPRIEAAGYVFVRDEENVVSGIITTADLTHEFARLAGPYFTLSEIERRLRRRIDRICPLDELRTATKRPKITSIDDTTLGQLVAVLKVDEHWKRLRWDVDQGHFIDELHHVRQTRNEVMHFRPDPLTEDQRTQLRRFANWLRMLDPLP